MFILFAKKSILNIVSKVSSTKYVKFKKFFYLSFSDCLQIIL